ncbi:MAG: protease complex subunit PrcB family protein [Candidatus Paceibacterota bacterium]|jgi:hypothetical protein
MQRDSRIILGVALVAVTVSVGFFLFYRSDVQNGSLSAAVNTQQSATAVPFTPLAEGSRSTVTRRVNYLITSPDQLSKLWKMVDATGTPPAVDFKTQAVIAVFAGERPAAGYRIAVSKVEDASARVVSITIAEPAADCMLAQTITAPYEVVAVPVTSLPFTHEDVSVTTTCAN